MKIENRMNKKQYMQASKCFRVIKNVAFSALAATFLMACDPLGLDPTDKVAEDKFWENKELARAYVDRYYLWAPVTANHFFT